MIQERTFRTILRSILWPGSLNLHPLIHGGKH